MKQLNNMKSYLVGLKDNDEDLTSFDKIVLDLFINDGLDIDRHFAYQLYSKYQLEISSRYEIAIEKGFAEPKKGDYKYIVDVAIRHRVNFFIDLYKHIEEMKKITNEEELINFLKL